jgi:uncharacterized protein YwbE
MKVVVGTNTIVKKVTVGTPLRVGNAANGSLTGLDDVNGIVNLGHDTILQYDSAAGKFKHVSPAALASDGLTVSASGMGSLSETGGTLTYVGPSVDSVRALFNVTYDSSALGTLVKTGGTTHLTGPTPNQIRGLFTAGNDLQYNAATGEFSVTVPSGSSGFDSNFNAKSTTNLPEGSNLYYTDSRGRAAVSVVDAGGFGSLAYNAVTGVLTYNGPSVSDIRSGINVGANLAYDSATGKITFTGSLGGTFDSDNARKSISVVDAGGQGSLAYNNGTGQITYTGATDSSTRGLFSATGDLTYDNGQFGFTQRTDAQVRGLLNAGSGITYDSATGKISANVGTHYADSDARQAISVQDLGGAGALSYNSSTGQISYQGATDSGMRGLISATGDITYNQNTGVINFTQKTDAQIRGLFNVSGDLGYDTGTGVFSVDLGSVDVTDSAVTRALLSVTNDDGDYGSLAYDAGTGQFAFTKVTDSDIRGSLSAAGDLAYNQTTGQFSYSKRTDADIRSLLSASGDLAYNSGTGQFSITTGAHYQDSNARHAISFRHTADSIANVNEYGTVTYNQATGDVVIYGTRDSDIRGSMSFVDAGGLGSLAYNENEGRVTYTGPSNTDIAGTLSATTDPLSMGKLTLDSSKGQFTLKLEDDSVRALFSVTSDNEGGSSLTYDSSTGQFVFSGPSTLDLRSKISVVDAGGDGSLTYFESGGVFTYTGPSPAEARAHFTAGLGLDYNQSTGTFRLDSSANIVTGSIVTGQLTSGIVSANTKLNVDTINSLSDSSNIVITGKSVTVKGTTDRILLDTQFLHTTDNRIIFAVDDSNTANYQGGGFQIGGGANSKYFAYSVANDFFATNTGLYIPGDMSGKTIDSLNKRIDELPDSAQMKGILSAGPGLSYDNTNGIYRIISSGVTAGTYGDATNVSQLTVDSLGIVTGAVNVPISTVTNNTFDSATGQLTITTATDSFNASITLDPFTTNTLAEGPNNLYYTRSRFDSALDDSTSETRIRQYFRTDLASDSSRQQVRKYINVGPSLSYDSATGKLTTNQALDSNSNVRFNNIVQTGQLQGPAEFIIDPAAIGDNTGTVKILGNLQVEGVQTIINSTTVSVNDKNIVLGDSAADSSALHGAGITLGGTNIVDKPSFTYSHAGQRFVFNRNIQADSFYGDVTGNVTGNVTGDVVGDLTGNVTGQVSDISNHTTTDLAEGNNKYFTIPRARNTIQAVDAGGDGSFIYDSSTGTMTYTGPSPTEVRAHVSLVDNGGDGEMSYDAATGIISYTGPSEAEWYQHFVDNADSLGDMVWDSNYGTKGGLRLHERHILGLQETGVDSFVAAQEFIMYYSGTAGSLRKLNLNTFSSLVGGGGGGSKLFGFINL